jgi:putative acetyltransferase
MQIRAQRDEDADAVHAVTTRAFSTQAGVADLVDALTAGPARLSLVAESDSGEIVGHTMLSRGWVDALPSLVEVLILSPLSVEPAVQRQGIGSALVRAALAGAEELGAPALFLEGSPVYYSRFGFVGGATQGFVRPSARIPEPGFQVVTLPAWEAWMTGALVYPEAFWQLDFVGLRA